MTASMWGPWVLPPCFPGLDFFLSLSLPPFSLTIFFSLSLCASYLAREAVLGCGGGDVRLWRAIADSWPLDGRVTGKPEGHVITVRLAVSPRCAGTAGTSLSV